VDQNKKNTFALLKQEFSSAPVLGFFDRNALTTVIADASPVGLEAILLQQQEDGTRIIRYASYALSDVGRYSQTQKEAYAAVWVCKKFYLYLFMRPFMLTTNCKALEFIFGNRSKLSLRIEHWVLQLPV
jgi:hypothetical protein